VVFAVCVVTEARVLEGVFAFGAMDKGLRRLIEVDSVSLDNFSIGGFLSERPVRGVELWRSQDTALWVGEGMTVRGWRMQISFFVP